MTPIMETVSDFAKRTNLPEKVIRAMVKQGQLPLLKTAGNCHVRIHVDAALEVLKQIAIHSAAEIAATMPVPIRTNRFIKTASNERKYKGRPPDKVRKAAR